MPKRKRVSDNKRGRVSNKKRTRLQRRVDALARVLECANICIAIAFIGERAYVSSNAIYKNSRKENDSIKLINDTMLYFTDIAEKS